MTAPSVLTFIALADELNRAMSALQAIANGNVGDPMEYAQKTLEVTADAFLSTHERIRAVDSIEQPLKVHKLSDAYIHQSDSQNYIAAVVYRADHGRVYAMPRGMFEEQFIRIPK